MITRSPFASFWSVKVILGSLDCVAAAFDAVLAGAALLCAAGLVCATASGETASSRQSAPVRVLTDITVVSLLGWKGCLVAWNRLLRHRDEWKSGWDIRRTK